jgi:phenylpropionate dioxygenase-like ring-hydroxylating dioxygenase large terminal subunit
MSIDQATIDKARRLLDARKPKHALARPFYTDEDMFQLDMELIYGREWILAGHACEVANPGDYLVVDIGLWSVIVVRDLKGTLRAHHNTCRHRGSRICEASHGHVQRRLVCPYHQWSYELDGQLARTRAMATSFDASQHGLKPAHVADVGGHVFISVAETPPDIAPFRQMVQPYLAPLDMANTKVAFESRVVEDGNWKLVMENNRECYHCAVSHPELCRTFPETTAHSGHGPSEDLKAIEDLVARCEALGLPGRFVHAPDWQYRAMRMPLLDGARSMTMSGKPAVKDKRLGKVPAEPDTGDLLFYHFPSSWNHFTLDHALMFRVIPLSPNRTELVSKWLVPKDAQEGVDYDLKTLTEVWTATNEQDTRLVERNQRGVSSPAYEPGPYSDTEEEGVIQLVDWYCGALERGLASMRV